MYLTINAANIKNKLLISIVFLLFSFSLPIFAASTIIHTYENSQFNKQKSTGLAMRANIDIIHQLKIEQNVRVSLPNIGQINGIVKRKLKGRKAPHINKSFLRSPGLFNNESESIIISLADKQGMLKIDNIEGQTKRITWLNLLEKKIYSTTLDNQGNGAFSRQNPNEFYCVDYATETATTNTEKNLALNGSIPTLSQLTRLQSRPSARQVIFIDYWGGRLTNTAWNDNFNNGNPINYLPYDRDGNPNTFSESERNHMWIGWLEMAEDYAPFNVNITTDINIYRNTSPANRARVIATPTNYFFPGAGGVAYLNAYYGSDPDYWRIAWTWNRSISSMGQTHSHEAGHMLGLSHDGVRNGSSYYRGHGDWGPIMGAPFGKSYVQWSRGDYPNANNTENDLQIISNLLPPINDDAGNHISSARILLTNVRNFEGVISPNPFFNDIDVYAIEMHYSGELHINVAPLLGDENKTLGANATFNYSIIDSSNNILATHSNNEITPLQPTLNQLNETLSVNQGFYYLIIDANSPNINWSSGFDEYGNAGRYRIDIDKTYNDDSTPPPSNDNSNQGDDDFLLFLPAILAENLKQRVTE